jgi:phenylalanyl-tRNA synthetase beta chain
VRRDLALVVKEGLAAADLMDKIRQSAGPLLQNLVLFDVYCDVSLGAGMKSVAFALYLQHSERTLTDDEINQCLARVTTALAQDFDAKLREAST